jgi:hypothetical protein
MGRINVEFIAKLTGSVAVAWEAGKLHLAIVNFIKAST